jgi:transcriptional regulator with XRE-family HTH domain
MIDQTEVAIIKIVGGRMREARELCKLPRHVAADRLGVSDQSLDRIESGIDIETIALKVIRQASLIYDVSVDFLLGFSDDWEVDPKTRQDREFAAYLHQEQAKLFSRWAVNQLRVERQMKTLSTAVNALRIEVAETFEALDTFEALNPGFKDLPGGSMIRYRIEKANRAAQNAYLSLVRCRAIK